MGIGLLFPGQASQFSGMGKELHNAYGVAREVFQEASEALSQDIATLCFRGMDAELRLTKNTQPAIFTVSVAAFRVLKAELDIHAACAAGHSLGEYSALVAAGVLPLRDVVQVLRSRGQYMQDAVPVGEGAMAVLIGLPHERVEAVCQESSAVGVVCPANLNGGDQIVISGSAKAVQAACSAAKTAGAKMVLPLPVSAPFHCSLMRPAAERLAPELRAIPQKPFQFPVVANVTAAPYDPGETVAEVLIRQITSPVRWEESVRTMLGLGVTAFIEVGPGKVLSGLVQRIEKDALTTGICGPADLSAVRALPASAWVRTSQQS
jgi:[acyl-carrier-protein] S-malonyltransferase